MESHYVDFEIIYAVKDTHTFTKIWEKVKRIGSKQTFSKHLKALVESKVIKKITKNGKPEYWINDPFTGDYEQKKLELEFAEKEITRIKNKSKKLSDKKLLELFVSDTVANLLMHSSFHLDLLMPHAKTIEFLNRGRFEKLDEMIKTRMDILMKRDGKLLIVFYDIVDDILQNKLKT